jgi:cell division protein FtsB
MIKNVLFLFVVLAAVFVVYLPSYMQMQDLRNRNLTFEKRITDLEAETLKMAEERDRLKNDPEYFERVARERMGLIKDGEVVYKVLPPGVKKTAPVEEVKKVTKPTTKTTAKKKTTSSTKKTTTTSTKKVTTNSVKPATKD